MNDFFPPRKSWDTALKHLTRYGVLDDILNPKEIASMPVPIISRVNL